MGEVNLQLHSHRPNRQCECPVASNDDIGIEHRGGRREAIKMSSPSHVTDIAHLTLSPQPAQVIVIIIILKNDEGVLLLKGFCDVYYFSF